MFNISYVTGFCSVVVVTSASHAEGHRFEPCQKHSIRKTLKQENKCFSFTSIKNVTHFRCLFFSSCLFVLEIFTFHKFASINMVRQESYYCSAQVVEIEKWNDGTRSVNIYLIRPYSIMVWWLLITMANSFFWRN